MIAALQTALRIPFEVDLERLHADLEVANREEYRPHFAPEYHDGGWLSMALVSQGGRPDAQEVGPEPYRPTPLLERCPYFAEILSRLPGEARRVRLLRVLPGARVFAHYDNEGSIDYPVVRFHLPIETDPAAYLVIGGQTWRFGEGELWYADFVFPHSVVHDGTRPRTHLVIDLTTSESVRALFPRSYLRGALLRGLVRRAARKLHDARTMAARLLRPSRRATPSPTA